MPIKRMLQSILIVLVLLAITLTAVVFLYQQQTKFGRLPSGNRLARIEQSPHYRDGKFHNLAPKPDLVEGVSFTKNLWRFLFHEKERPVPVGIIPSMKTDLSHTDDPRDILVWFGHSSYFLRVDGKTMLVDPHFSPNASPLSFTTHAFAGTRPYRAEDMPFIDYVFISHDHWDHLDYETVLTLRDRVGKFICGLGVGEHLEYWGIMPDRIIEMDWNEATTLDPGFTVQALTTHHFSGRTLRRNPALWVSFLLQTPKMRLYFGGDSGFGPHFKEIGERFGGVDLAVLENGQYDANWPYIHMQPEEVRQAALDLGARMLLPVHSSKFELANHSWDEPLRRITALCESVPFRLLMPLIGEAVFLGDTSQTFNRWWESVE